jgi:type VI secretion system protein ImpE
MGFIPTRYPGTLASKDPELLLSRKTDWVEAAEEWSVPVGQRVLVTDAEETALMDVRKITVTPAAEDGSEPAPEDGAA